MSSIDNSCNSSEKCVVVNGDLGPLPPTSTDNKDALREW